MSDIYLSIDEAVRFINENFNKNVTTSNISYLIKYGQIQKHTRKGKTVIRSNDLEDYYRKFNETEIKWKSKIGEELNWELSFDSVKEYERTKHVHRLHPYKGKFIPQLVDYFLNDKLNGIKKEVFFKPGDIVIDPFCGSGTTLVQANELGIHAIGIDISEFNALMSNIKVGHHDIIELQKVSTSITQSFKLHFSKFIWNDFDAELVSLIGKFNKEYFPTPEILYRIKNHEIELPIYSKEKEKLLKEQFHFLLRKYQLNVIESNSNNSFINKWFTPPIKQQLIFLLDQINKIKDKDIRNTLLLILSRTARSCRATTHSDLATIIDPVLEPYYCHKHNKMCKPLFSLSYWWEFYSKDTILRLHQFSNIRSETFQTCLTGDSKTIDLINELSSENPTLGEKLSKEKAKGIFTSPPYVGLIDYHEQHAYAYELLNLPRRDNEEIGPQSKGKGSVAREKYVQDIADVLVNIQRVLQENCEIFIVANDSYGLYPRIAEKSNLKIIEEFKRPVLNRTEKDKSAYSEKIFRLKRA